MGEKTLSVIEILKHPKVKLGIICLVIALLMGFSSIYVTRDDSKESGTLDSRQSIALEIAEPGLEGELKLSYVGPEEDGSEASIEILDREEIIIQSDTLEHGENLSVNLESQMDTIFRADNNPGKLNYNLSYSYTRYPFRILSIPTLFMTMIGFLFVFKGYKEYLDEYLIKRRKESRLESAEKDDEKEIDFMGIEESEES